MLFRLPVIVPGVVVGWIYVIAAFVATELPPESTIVSVTSPQQPAVVFINVGFYIPLKTILNVDPFA